jgi:hypothetical protein
MRKTGLIIILLLLALITHAQLFVARDTIPVVENGKVLKMPWANGINFANISNVDLNMDGKLDLVAFDKLNGFGVGRFRCFVNTGIFVGGQTTYTFQPELSYLFPACANWALFYDYNCDGKEDLFCSTSAGMMVYANTSYTNAGGPATVSFTLSTPLLYTDYQGTPANLYAATNALPGLSDIDGDGDMDILTFSPGGVMIEYHKNMSMENYGNCNHLVFELATYCWGKVIESNCSFDLNQSCSFRPHPGNNIQANKNNMHSGSCLTCFDSDDDGDKDLVLGDIGCNVVQYGHNTGTAANAIISDTTKLYPNFPIKNNDNTLIKFNNFPCAYYVDIDGDNKKDLVATPNVPGSENYQSVWYYKNTSATGTVNFQFVKKNFLQDEMIEVGQNAFPVLFDYDADSKKDLLIGTYGYYMGNSLKAQLTLYRNIGTNAQPAYSLVTRDYAGMSSYSLNTIIPAVGDIDNDGDIDIILGTQSGQIYWLQNTAGAGATASFSFNTTAFFTTISAAATPQLFDLDNDGKLDLMIGGKNGRIAFYRNIGTPSAPSFTLQNSFFGGVNVQGDQNLYGFDGYAAPFFFKDGTDTKLLVGSVSGQVFYYAVPSASAPCILINSAVNGLNEGGQSSVYFEDINGDGKRDLFIGNSAGGLSFFSSTGPDVGMADLSREAGTIINIFPNPAGAEITVRIDKVEVDGGEWKLMDLLGKEIHKGKMRSNEENLNISGLAPGIYFIKIMVSQGGRKIEATKKLIKQ